MTVDSGKNGMPRLANALGNLIGKLPEQRADRVALGFHFGTPEHDRFPPEPFVELECLIAKRRLAQPHQPPHHLHMLSLAHVMTQGVQLLPASSEALAQNAATTREKDEFSSRWGGASKVM